MKRLEGLVLVAQGLADDVDPHMFARRVLSSAPDGDFKHRRYRKDYLFKAFLICTQLNSMRTMPELLYDVASLLFGTQTRAGMQGLIEAAANLQISRSVLSKSRILFDGVFMVHSRERYIRCGPQADASVISWQIRLPNTTGNSNPSGPCA